jgi:hypothetical protein
MAKSIIYKGFISLQGGSFLFGWIHEHCTGTNRRVRKWAAKEQVRRRLYSWKQRSLHFHSKTTRIKRSRKLIPMTELMYFPFFGAIAIIPVFFLYYYITWGSWELFINN